MIYPDMIDSGNLTMDDEGVIYRNNWVNLEDGDREWDDRVKIDSFTVEPEEEDDFYYLQDLHEDSCRPGF